MIQTTQPVQHGARLFIAFLFLLSSSAMSAQAQAMNHGSMGRGGMDMPMHHGSMNMGQMQMNGMAMEGMNHETMTMDDMQRSAEHGAMPQGGMAHESMEMNTGQHEGMPMRHVPDATRDKLYRDSRLSLVESSGCEPPVQIDPTTGAPACWPDPMMDEMPFGKVLIDRLELAYTDGADSYAWEAAAHWGNDFNKIRLETEGEGVQDGELESAEVQLLYSHLISSFFDILAGIRYDIHPDSDNRAFAVLGVQGLAPYWFEVEADLYLSEDGDLSFRGEFEYELLFTQRLILTPSFEITLAAQDVPEYGLGSGLRSTELGLRLRYEIRREFAPYIGVTYKQLYGETADFAEAAGEPTSSTAFVIGIRAWF